MPEENWDEVMEVLQRQIREDGGMRLHTEILDDFLLAWYIATT